MKKQYFFALLLCAATTVHGAEILNVVVNTSTISGSMGSIDFQFNPGAFTTQAATVQILSFTGATYIAGTQSDIGGVTGGPLPSILSIANSGLDNEDFEDIKFATSLAFTLSFSGPANTSPNASLSGSTFTLSLFKDAAGTMPVLTTNANGILGTVQLNPDSGALSSQAVSPNVQFTTPTPEPGSFLMLGAALLVLFAVKCNL